MDDDFWNKVSGISDDGDDEETFSEPSFSDGPEDSDTGEEEPYFPRESPMRRRRYAERAGYGEDDEPYRPRYYAEEAPQASAAPQSQAPQPTAEPAPAVDQSQPNDPGKVIALSLGVLAACALLATGRTFRQHKTRLRVLLSPSVRLLRRKPPQLPRLLLLSR